LASHHALQRTADHPYASFSENANRIETRPPYARVAKHNVASIRVLQKCGFQLARENEGEGDDSEELVMELCADRGAAAANKRKT